MVETIIKEEEVPGAEKLTKAQQKMIDEFRIIPLTGLDQALETSKTFGQYCLIVDKTENANVYFNYKAIQKDFYADVMSLRMEAETKDEICERLRKGLVFSMQRGEDYVLYCKTVKPDWANEFDHETLWPVQKIFDHDTWYERDEYI